MMPADAEKYVAKTKLKKIAVHSPAPQAVELAMKAVKRGGTVMMAVNGDIPFRFDGEVTVTSSIVGTKTDIREVVRLASAGKVKVRATPYPLSEGLDVLKNLKNGNTVGRAVLIP
jgi:propanol-preferring alcohol dehydrogenase